MVSLIVVGFYLVLVDCVWFAWCCIVYEAQSFEMRIFCFGTAFRRLDDVVELCSESRRIVSTV